MSTKYKLPANTCSSTNSDRISLALCNDNAVDFILRVQTSLLYFPFLQFICLSTLRHPLLFHSPFLAHPALSSRRYSEGFRLTVARLSNFHYRAICAIFYVLASVPQRDTLLTAVHHRCSLATLSGSFVGRQHSLEVSKQAS